MDHLFSNDVLHAVIPYLVLACAAGLSFTITMMVYVRPMQEVDREQA